MKKYLIAFVLILIFFIVIFILVKDEDNNTDVINEIEYISSLNTTNKIEISNPIFKSKGLNSNPYEISAKKGFQKGNDLELLEINAKFTNDEGEFLFARSVSGFYSRENSKIELLGNVFISDQFGSETSANRAIIDIDANVIQFIGKVVSIKNNIEIRSNSLFADDGGKILTYYDEVSIIRKVDKEYEEAFGDLARYDVAAEQINITGNVTVLKNNNTIMGHELIVDLINSNSIMKSNKKNQVSLKILD